MGMPGCAPGWGQPPGWMPGCGQAWPGMGYGRAAGTNSLWEEKMARLSGNPVGGDSGPQRAGSSKWDVGGPGSSSGSGGKILQGTIKSYSSVKGYGFIITGEIKQDVWFSEDSVDPDHRTSDLAG